MKSSEHRRQKISLRKETLLNTLLALFAVSIIVLVYSQVYSGVLPKLVEEINNGTIGVILTAVVTVFLLSRQSSSEELKEQKSKIFEKKLDIYHTFLEFLEELLKENQLKIDSSQKRDDLKGLLFQLANLKMHTDSEHVNKIFTCIESILTGLDKKDMNEAEYKTLATNLFSIVSLFQTELYKEPLGSSDLGREEIIGQIIKRAKDTSTGINPLQNEATLSQALKLNKHFREDIFKPIGKELVGRIKQELITRYGSDLLFDTSLPKDANHLFLFSLEVRRASWPTDVRVAIGEVDSDRALFAVRGEPKPDDSKLYKHLSRSLSKQTISREEIKVTGFGLWYPFSQKVHKFQKWTDDADIIMKFYKLDLSVITYIIDELVTIITEVDNFYKLNHTE